MFFKVRDHDLIMGFAADTLQTEDDGYYYTTDHNYTTPWDFRRDAPAPDVVVIFLGYEIILLSFKTHPNLDVLIQAQMTMGRTYHPQSLHRTT